MMPLTIAEEVSYFVHNISEYNSLDVDNLPYSIMKYLYSYCVLVVNYTTL